jgi:mono/diheme cytochrome c family protein
MKALKTSVLIIVVMVVLAALTLYSGMLSFAADEPHRDLTTRIIESARERSIASQSKKIEAPANLSDAKLIGSGAGEYAAMCAACHLAPGMKDTELRLGLYPKPPKLAEHGSHRTAGQQFWIVKHGLKLSGMPAWGLTHDDQRIWSMVAFLRKLPELTPEAYQQLVESSGAHHHDGEAEEHDHSDASKLPAAANAAAALIDQFQSSLMKSDTQAAANLLEPAVLIFEGGEVERSRAEYASHHLQADASFLKGARVKLLTRAGDAVGDFAWVATESELTTQGDKPTNVVTTETMILKRESPGWRIAHIHWSSRKK